MRTRPDVVTRLNLKLSSVDLDEGGYLTDPANWSPEFAEHIAAQEGISLRDEHWDVIRFMRVYLDEHGIAADARFVLKYLAAQHNTDKIGANQALFDLFPYGYVKQACKMAGMKQPRAWSTG